MGVRVAADGKQHSVKVLIALFGCGRLTLITRANLNWGSRGPLPSGPALSFLATHAAPLDLSQQRARQLSASFSSWFEPVPQRGVFW